MSSCSGLLAGGADREANIVSALVETVTRLVVQELLEGEQGDFLAAAAATSAAARVRLGSRNGYERGRLRTAEGFIDVAVPQVRGAAEPFRSSLMGFLDGNSEVLESLVNEMYARGLSTRDVEDAFRDATGELLISKSRGQRDHRPAVGGLPGLHQPGPVRHRGGVPVRRCGV